MNRPLLHVFVYGSLKRGHSNHGRYCRGVLSIEIAEVVGQLCLTAAGFCVLAMANDGILARAANDPLSDVETQDRFTRAFAGQKEDVVGKRRVQGQILTFGDPVDRVRELDRLEEFEVNRRSFYERALIRVFSRIRQQDIAVWTYIAGALSRNRPTIPTGLWTGRKH